MKRGDPLTQHHERLRDLHASFHKKTQYHSQKAFLDIKDIYWLVHEFFSAFLDKQHSFTEEELVKEIAEFKHEFVSVPHETAVQWEGFLQRLSRYQYSGENPDQPTLHALLDEFSALVDQTIGKATAPPDALTKQVQEAGVYVKHGELERAEEVYRRIMHQYDSLPAEKRKEHYEQVKQLYKSIADARSAPAATHR